MWNAACSALHALHASRLLPPPQLQGCRHRLQLQSSKVKRCLQRCVCLSRLVFSSAPRSFKDVDIALFSAGGSISKKLGPVAAAAGCIVVDNSSAFRMTDGVPLVIPEVNPQASGMRDASLRRKGAALSQAYRSLVHQYDVSNVFLSLSGKRAVGLLVALFTSPLNPSRVHVCNVCLQFSV